MTVSSNHVYRKEVSMASDMVNRPWDVGNLKMGIPDHDFDSVYVFLFSVCGMLRDCYLAVCSRLKITDRFDSLQRSLFCFPKNFDQRK